MTTDASTSVIDEAERAAIRAHYEALTREAEAEGLAQRQKRLLELGSDIALLKRALKATAALRESVDGYSRALACEFEKPRAEITRQLSWLLLTRENLLDGEG